MNLTSETIPSTSLDFVKSRSDASKPYIKLSNSILKVLKILKNNSSQLYLRIRHKELHLRSIDFKEGLGLLDCTVFLNESTVEALDLLVEIDQLIKLLENFKEDTKWRFHLEEQYLLITDNQDSSTSKFYIFPYEASLKSSNLLDLTLVPLDEVDKPYGTFEIDSHVLADLFKAVTAVDNTICVLFLKSDQGIYALNVNAKKDTNIFQFSNIDQKSIREVTVSTNKVYNEYVFYYPYNLYNNLFKVNDTGFCSVSFYEDYVLLTDKDPERKGLSYCLHLPLKSTKWL